MQRFHLDPEVKIVDLKDETYIVRGKRYMRVKIQNTLSGPSSQSHPKA